MQPSEVLSVTPKMAHEWLDSLSSHQRSVSPNYVTQLARKMRNGQWRLTAEPITFDTDGKLIEGQHRLRAVIESGVAVEFMVVRGAPAESFAVIDQGRRRNAAQFYDGKYAGQVMAGARFLRHIEVHLPYNTAASAGSWNQLSMDDQLEYVTTWPELAEAAPLVEPLSRRSALIQVPSRYVLPVVAQAMRTEHADRIAGFLTGMHTGQGLDGDNDPRMLLHRRFTSMLRAQLMSSQGADLAYSLTAKAWNFYVEGAQMKLLKMVVNERRTTVLGSKAATEWQLEPVIVTSKTTI